MVDRPVIGVLALQGDFEAHAKALERAGATPQEVRHATQLAQVDALVIPGGESTTMLKLMEYENLFEPLREFGQSKPVFGTCAGAILLASDVLNPKQPSFGLMDMTVERNGYGRQIDSRITQIQVDGEPSEAVFIRAPIIRRTGANVRVLASYLDAPVLVEQGKHMAATYHPELTTDTRVHKRFVENVKGSRA